MDDFGQFLDSRMEARNIRNDAELSRLSGVKQTQISNWRRGLARPAPESLDKIAAVLNVASAVLYQLTGHLSELDPIEIDLRVIPDEFRNLIDLYNSDRPDDDDRAFLRRHVGLLIAGLVADLDSRDRSVSPPPAKRQRRGRRAA